jgi:putative methionine-R-sulfoxide reductase with GAF domain
MLRKIVILIFIFCASFSTACEFVLSYPTIAPDGLTVLVSEISFLLAFIQLLALMSGIYICFFSISKVEIKSIKLDVFDDKKTAQSNEEITLEIEIEKETELKLTKSEEAITKRINEKKELNSKVENALWSLCDEFNLSQGIVYKNTHNNLEPIASFAYYGDSKLIPKIEIGDGITGQAAKNGKYVYLDEVPKGYLKVVSGLGDAFPNYILIVPIKNSKSSNLGVLELSGMGNLNNKEIEGIVKISAKIFSELLSK